MVVYREQMNQNDTHLNGKFLPTKFESKVICVELMTGQRIQSWQLHHLKQTCDRHNVNGHGQ